MKKLQSGILALILLLTLLIPAAGAAEFSDIETHWARPDIERMVAAGMFKGYEDGTFGPERLMITSEALALCARIAVPAEEMRIRIGRDRADEVDALLDGRMPWFINDFATCLETGIITHEALSKLLDTGLYEVPMQKAEFARNLVYAMGLGSLAESLEAAPLYYTDATEVPEAFRRHIYLLDLYGVVNGTPEGEIQPLTPLNRAVAATMIGRVLDSMETLDVDFELPRYTDYDWTAGLITNVESGLDRTLSISLGGPLGAQTVELPVTGVIYQNNMTAQQSVLRNGAYARLALNTDGRAEAVRVVAAEQLSEISGLLSDLTLDEVSMGGRSYPISRFTVVTAGGRVGDRGIIDFDAGYTVADCVTDNMDNVLFLTLKGGSRELAGILREVEVNAVTGAVTIAVAAYDGQVQRYSVPDDVPVTAQGIAAVLRTTTAGAHITLRVDNDDLTAVQAIELDTVNRYMQGALNSIGSGSSATANITELPGTRTGTYAIASDCVVEWNGGKVSLASIKSGSYVTALIQGGQVIRLSAWPGVVENRGKLTAIRYGESTILSVTDETGVTREFAIPRDDIGSVSITRSGSTANITQLSTGDSVTVTVRYHAVSSIAATPRAADVSGMVEELSFIAGGGANITLALPDGTRAVYYAAPNLTVTLGGKIAALTDIKVGVTLGLVTEETRVLAIEIQQAAVSSTKLEGVVYLREQSGRRLTLTTPDGLGGERLVVVAIPENIAHIQDTLEGSVAVNKLAAGDRLEIWGRYENQAFLASAVVRIR